MSRAGKEGQQLDKTWPQAARWRGPAFAPPSLTCLTPRRVTWREALALPLGWGSSGVPHGYAHGSVPRHERLREDLIGHAPPLGDPRSLIKGPVNTEIDAALAVFCLSLREQREAARAARAHVALIVAGHAVELVRD